MNLAKFSGLALVLPTLVGCSASDSAPTTVLTKDNLVAVAGEGLLDANAIVHAWIRLPNDAFAPTTTPCTDGGTLVSDRTSPFPTVHDSYTYHQCAQDDATTDGTLEVAATPSNTSLLAITLNLTITSSNDSIVETGRWTREGEMTDAFSRHILSDGVSLAFSSATTTDKITLSSIDISNILDNFANSTLTDSYTVESTRLGGRFLVETKTPLVTTDLEFHPESGQFTITGARGAKLVVTILGTDGFQPPIDQGQIKLELDAGDGAAPVTEYASWDDLDAASLGLEFALYADLPL